MQDLGAISLDGFGWLFACGHRLDTDIRRITLVGPRKTDISLARRELGTDLHAV